MYPFFSVGIYFLLTVYYAYSVKKLCPKCGSKRFSCDSVLDFQETAQKQVHVLKHNTGTFEWIWNIVTISHFTDQLSCLSCKHAWEESRTKETY